MRNQDAAVALGILAAEDVEVPGHRGDHARQPAAAASSIESGMPSNQDGSTNTSCSASNAGSSARATRLDDFHSRHAGEIG